MFKVGIYIKDAPKRFWVHLLFLGMIAQPAFAASLDESLQKAKDLRLAQHPVWRNLLYIEGGKSAVTTKEYFFAKDGRYNPQAELEATIKSFYNSSSSQGRKDPRCQFPARYHWLSKHIDLPFRDLREDTCISSEQWKIFDNTKSISLLLVSGYWGNPASTFGHSFLRLNVTSAEDPHDLFDRTINYGAITPPGENPFIYMGKGVFGGYEGTFSDQYFYTHDLTYTRTEFRDIWDFELDLTQEQKTLLIYHLWEITHKRFKYYFITKNCAFRLAALADLAIEEDVQHRLRPWFIPEEMFVRLKKIDKARKTQGKGPLIRSVRYIPSSKRLLFAEIKNLKPQELGAFNRIVQSQFKGLDDELNALEMGPRINVLNALLAFQKYRLISQGKKVDEEMLKIKDQILLARLKLPARKDPNVKVAYLPSPVDGSPPMSVQTGIGVQREGDSFLRLSLAPFKKEIVGQNNLEGNEFSVLELNLGFFQEKKKAFMDQFDLFRVMNFETMPLDVIKGSKMSWQGRLAVDRVEDEDRNRYDGVASAGVGRAHRFNDHLMGYVMLDAQGHTLAPYGRLRPHLGWRVDTGDWKTWLYGGVETTDYDGHVRDVWGGKLQYSIDQRTSINFELNNQRATKMALGMSLYW